jgi:hypothetical protein
MWVICRQKICLCTKCVGGGNLEFHSNGCSFFLSFSRKLEFWWVWGDHALNEDEAPQPACWLSGFSSPLHNEGQQIWLVGRPILTNPKKNNFALCKQFGFCCCCCCFGFMHLKFDILWGDKYTTAPKLLWRFLNYGYILGLFLQIVKNWNNFLWHVN